MLKLNDKKILMMIVSGLFVLLMAACANTDNLPSNPTSSDILRNTLRVTGTGQATGTPDLARVDLGVETRDEDIAVAVDETNRKMSELTEALSNVGIAKEDLLTTQYNIRQDEPIDPQTGRPVGTGEYVVSNTLKVTVREIDQISQVIETGLNAGANRVFGLAFDIEDTSTLESQARSEAIQDAMNRAQELADGLEIALGQPIYISEGFADIQPVIREAPQAAMGGGPSISTGQLTVAVQVNLIFAIE
jgi:uncharacterized protein YggE